MPTYSVAQAQAAYYNAYPNVPYISNPNEWLSWFNDWWRQRGWPALALVNASYPVDAAIMQNFGYVEGAGIPNLGAVPLPAPDNGPVDPAILARNAAEADRAAAEAARATAVAAQAQAEADRAAAEAQRTAANHQAAVDAAAAFMAATDPEQRTLLQHQADAALKIALASDSDASAAQDIADQAKAQMIAAQQQAAAAAKQAQDTAHPPVTSVVPFIGDLYNFLPNPATAASAIPSASTPFNAPAAAAPAASGVSVGNVLTGLGLVLAVVELMGKKK